LVKCRTSDFDEAMTMYKQLVISQPDKPWRLLRDFQLHRNEVIESHTPILVETEDD